MLHDDDHRCGSIGRWVALLCAALGVITAYIVVLGLKLSWIVFPSAFPKEILVGLVVLFIAAAVLGKKAGIYLCNKTHATGRNVLVGVGVAFGSIAAAVLVGAFVGYFGEMDLLRRGEFTVSGLVLAPFILLFFVLWFGGIPAILLGVFYGFLVRNRLRKLK